MSKRPEHSSDSTKVIIRPRVTVLSVLAHLEYKAWYALAEYVDNSIESFSQCREKIRELEGPDARLRVDIDVDSGLQRITIRDNAGGIALEDFPRAFRPAEIPPNTGGLSEFGMGMKSASCWFAPLWRVTTSALGEDVQRTVTFDIEQIVEDQIEELEVTEEAADPDAHFTTIELERVRSMPTGRTSGKIRDHLTDIYREFLRSGELELRYKGSALRYEEPAVLEAPQYDQNNEPEGDPKIWRKEINFDFGTGLSARGFAALRETASTKYAGFSLFRRRRVIEGSADEKYRPSEIFGAPNSFYHQRLFGELHLTGFDVSHTKDGFRWDESEESFLELLRDHIDSEELPILRQARNYREKAARAARGEAAQTAVSSTASSLTKHGPQLLPILAGEPATEEAPPESLDEGPNAATRTFKVPAEGATWTITIELSTDDSLQEWLSISEVADTDAFTISVRIGLGSPFMKRIVKLDEAEALEPVVRIAAGIALAENLARHGGVTGAGDVRRRLNRILGHALSLRE